MVVSSGWSRLPECGEDDFRIEPCEDEEAGSKT
jgi:hypothetical protein